MVRRFVEEAQIGGQLQHPGIVPVYELGSSPTAGPYFTMKLVKGRTLAALLEERARPGRRPAPASSAIFEQVCQTVAYAHARGVIHRDLKPSNVMVGGFGEVQVMDWGLAKVLGRAASPTRPRTAAGGPHEPQVTTVRTAGRRARTRRPGAVLGTPAYMAPEQARGEVDGLDERADVFALGAILCEILTGQPPYVGSRPQVLEDAAAGASTTPSPASTPAAPRPSWSDSPGVASTPRVPSGPATRGSLAREVAAFLASVGDRARAAEVAAAEARATAAAERKARRRTTVLASALGLAITTGVVLAVVAERAAPRPAPSSRSPRWPPSSGRRTGSAIRPGTSRPTSSSPGSGHWPRCGGPPRSSAPARSTRSAREGVARLLDELRREEEQRPRARPPSTATGHRERDRPRTFTGRPDGTDPTPNQE